MSTKLAVAAFAVAALALDVPAATAHPPNYDCVYTSFRMNALSATNEGFATGYVAHDAAATVRCYVMVNGTPVSSTPTGPAVTAGHISYTAGGTDVVSVCAEVTVTHGTVSKCGSWRVEESLYGVVATVDPAVCQVLGVLDGEYTGLVVVGPDGDVYVDGKPVWDCPPYD